MQNKLLFLIVVFCCLCTAVFAQDKQIEHAAADSFIALSFWYRRYLPPEDVPGYDVLRQALIEAKETAKFDKVSNDMSAYIHDMNNKLFEKLNWEITLRDEKMDTLKGWYSTDEEIYAEVRQLDMQYSVFRDNVLAQNYPQDDACLGQIDEDYSRLVTSVSYINENYKTYIVQSGDYFRKIALKFYGEERLWPRIWRDEVNYKNEKFLPDPENPNHINPNVEIRIP